MISVRVAGSEGDWQQGLAILFAVYVGEGYSPAERAALMFRRDVLEKEGDLLIAVRDDGTICGATILLRSGSSLQQLARQGEREFRLLAVGSSARGLGAGEALVRACIERCEADRATGLVLWTRPEMLAAQRLYERLGFLRVPERDEEDPRGFQRLVYLAQLIR